MPELSPAVPTVASDRREDPPWAFLDVVVIAAAAVVSIFVIGGLALGFVLGSHIFAGAPPEDLAKSPKIIVPAQALSYLVVVLFMVYIVGRRSRLAFWEAVRWNWPRTWGAYAAGGVVLAYGITALSAILPVPKQLPIDKFFHDATDAWLMAVFGTFVAPVVEELFYRGFLYPVIARRLGMSAGVVLTAIPFALMHSSQLGSAWAPLLMLFVVGSVLTLVRAQTRSVAAGVCVHAAYNATLFLMLYLSTDHFRHLEKALQ